MAHDPYGPDVHGGPRCEDPGRREPKACPEDNDLLFQGKTNRLSRSGRPRDLRLLAGMTYSGPCGRGWKQVAVAAGPGLRRPSLPWRGSVSGRATGCWVGEKGMIISRDRVRRGTIIYATAWLPRRSRVALRQRMMSTQLRGMLARSDMVMLRHPKAGSTLLRILLTRLYADRDGISSRRVFTSDELALQRQGLPRWVIGNGYMNVERLIADAYSAEDPLLAGKRTILLARHPADIVVSWHRQYQNRTKAFRRELIEADINATVDWQSLDRWSFIQRSELGLPAIIRYYRFWAETLADRPDAMILRYEDLRSDTAATLRRLVDFLGERFSDEAIDAAAAFGSAENLARLEREGYFQNASMRLRRPAASTPPSRQGAKAAGFDEGLTAEQMAWIDEQVQASSHPLLGYGGDAEEMARR